MIGIGKIVMGMAGVGLAGAGVLSSGGLVRMKVIKKEPQGYHINVIAPAILAPIAVHLAPERDLAQAAREIGPYLPVIRAALIALRDTGDAAFVELRAPKESVQVSKSGGSIIVDVDDAGETVRVSAPTRAILSTVDELAAATPNRL